MPVIAEKSIWKSQVFCASEEAFSNLKRLCFDFTEEIVIKIYCKDEINRNFTSFEEFFLFSNLKEQRIHTIVIYGIKNSQHDLKIQLSNSWPNNIYFEIQGPEDFVTEKYSKIQQFLVQIKPWYGIFSKIDYFHFCVWAFNFYIWIKLFFDILQKANSEGLAFMQFITKHWPNKVDFKEIPIAKELIKLTIFPFFTGVLLNVLRNRFFPCYYFSIGHGKEDYKFDENIRWVVVIGFIISFFGSIAAGFFQI